MQPILSEGVLRKKTEMYAMIIAIESDFICNFFEKLTLSDIPKHCIENATPVQGEANEFISLLRGMDIQAYIEICNSNIEKLNITLDQRKFINAELSKIIPIRNAVMHPRPLGFYDHAMLTQAFSAIETSLKALSWENVKKTKNQIDNHPETLLPPPSTLKKSNSVYENLPTLVDYEETSFIGRKREIGELKTQLKRRNVNILSVIGDGGVGKTALTLKLLYDLLDDETCPFEIIIWASLKTNELSGNEFAEIKESIHTTAEMYSQLSDFLGTIPSDDPKELIIDIAKNFCTLFVLDNLETINSSDVKSFLDKFSEYGKVLITSRIGLGEMEHRYRLNGLDSQDVMEYADALLSLYGFECLYTNERKKQIFQNELHSNPLAIKWFIRCLYNGQETTAILAHKNDVINFCMANVYEKLSSDAHRTLDILTVAGIELTYPELLYYLGSDMEESVRISYAVNELGKCNFIDDSEFIRNKKVAVTSFAREFLQANSGDANHLLAKFKEKQKKLLSFGQQLQINRAQNEFNLRSLYFKNESELVSAYYLDQALKACWSSPARIDQAIAFVEFAKMLTPGFFECNLVAAEVHTKPNPLKATLEYDEAILNCATDTELLKTYIQFSRFLIKNNDFYKALELLSAAESLDPICAEVKFEKAKVLSYIGEYDNADNTLNGINKTSFSSRDNNRFLTMKADIIRRRAELIDIRETQKRLNLLKQAFSYLENAKEPDSQLIEHMVIILTDAMYLYMDNDALNFVLLKVQKYYSVLRGSSKYKNFRKIVSDRNQSIGDLTFKTKMAKYVVDYNQYLHLLGENEGLVYNLKGGYGFCKNKDFPAGLYFSRAGLPQNITYGDIISYSSIVISKGRPAAVCPKRVGSIDEKMQIF